MTNKNPYKIADKDDLYLIEEIKKHDAISYEKIRKNDKANGCEVNVKLW
jgi:hypothetical protein